MSKARELASLGNAYSDGALSNRNLIINGAMQVAQRGTSVTGKTTGGYATVDRWKFIVGSAGTWTEEQGASLGEFGNSFKITCTTADASLSAGDYVQIETALEGQNLQHIRKGTSDAKPLVLSFAARSDDAKSFVVEVYDNDNARHYCELFTLTGGGAVDTFVMSIPADTTGALGNDNAASLYVTFWLAAGTNYSSGTLPITWSGVTAANRAAGCSNFADATGNYFEVSGVQLEVGDTATPFEHRSYGQELALCQRYYQKIGGAENNLIIGHSHTYSGGYSYGVFKYDAPMRAIPSGSVSTNAAGAWRYRYGSGLNVDNIATQVGIDQFGISQCRFFMSHGQAANTQGWIRGQSSASYVVLDAEL